MVIDIDETSRRAGQQTPAGSQAALSIDPPAGGAVFDSRETGDEN
jgi:hypothetical protein